MGRLLTWRLIARGDRVTLFNRGTLSDPFAERVDRIRGDRSAGELSRHVASAGLAFDAVVDFAAYRGEEIEEAIRALRGRVDHYVLISTGQVYLVREGCPSPSSEDDYDGRLLPRPDRAGDRAEWEYGVGKRACEDALFAADRSGWLHATTIRIPMVNGERDYHRRIESYLWRILDGAPVILPNGGGHRVRHVYGADVARAIAAMLGDPRAFGRAFNLSQDEMPTLYEVLSLLADLLGAPLRAHDVPLAEIEKAGLEITRVSPFSGRWMSCLDPARARAEVAFEHRPLARYLENIVSSFLAHTPQMPPDNYLDRPLERALARIGSGS